MKCFAVKFTGVYPVGAVAVTFAKDEQQAREQAAQGLLDYFLEHRGNSCDDAREILSVTEVPRKGTTVLHDGDY